MKSAYERAMERFGSEPVRTLSQEQKTALAEIDRKYKAKVAEADLSANRRRASAADQAARDQVGQDLVVELASLREKCEREKDRIRNASA